MHVTDSLQRPALPTDHFFIIIDVDSTTPATADVTPAAANSHRPPVNSTRRLNPPPQLAAANEMRPLNPYLDLLKSALQGHYGTVGLYSALQRLLLSFTLLAAPICCIIGELPEQMTRRQIL
jgi:hypothetical protein